MLRKRFSLVVLMMLAGSSFCYANDPGENMQQQHDQMQDMRQDNRQQMQVQHQQMQDVRQDNRQQMQQQRQNVQNQRQQNRSNRR